MRDLQLLNLLLNKVVVVHLEYLVLCNRSRWSYFFLREFQTLFGILLQRSKVKNREEQTKSAVERQKMKIGITELSGSKSYNIVLTCRFYSCDSKRKVTNHHEGQGSVLLL